MHPVLSAAHRGLDMKRLPLSRLLQLQIVYAFLGVMYNLGSMVALRNSEPAWAPTDPVFGTFGMAMVALFVAAGLLKTLTLYRVLMGIAVILAGYGGVITHLLNIGHVELYQSIWTWAGAIIVNSFGLALNLIAALGWFERNIKIA